MDERAARELARIKAEIKAGRHPVTAAEVRCSPRPAHTMLSAHPLGSKEFLIWRRRGDATGRVRDSEQWQRDGWSTPGLDQAGFAPLDELALIVTGPDTDSTRDLLGIDFPDLACRCRMVPVGSELVGRIADAITQWWMRSQAGSARTIVVIAR